VPVLDWNDVVSIGVELPEVECSTAYRRPALRVRGKMLTCVGPSPQTIVMRVARSERAQLLAAEPERFYITPHYENHPSMLVRLGRIDRPELRELLIDAWLMQAPKSLRNEHEDALVAGARGDG
jgi:hypothetical protein